MSKFRAGKESPKEVRALPERGRPIDERTPSPSPPPPSYELDEVTNNYIDEIRDDAVLRLANEVVAMFRDGKQDEIKQVSDAIRTAKVVATKRRLNADFLRRRQLRIINHQIAKGCHDRQMPKAKDHGLRPLKLEDVRRRLKHPYARMFTDPDHR
jgi:hypothetical protein